MRPSPEMTMPSSANTLSLSPSPDSNSNLVLYLGLIPQTRDATRKLLAMPLAFA